jgi:hypothetical protein
MLTLAAVEARPGLLLVQCDDFAAQIALDRAILAIAAFASLAITHQINSSCL